MMSDSGESGDGAFGYIVGDGAFGYIVGDGAFGYIVGSDSK